MIARWYFLVLLFPFVAKAQNVYKTPDDILVDTTLFNTSEQLVAWEEDWCPVRIQTDGDTVFVECYTVTYRDHYRASIELCPDSINNVGGVGLFNGDPRLLDSLLIVDMEADGSNLIHTDGVRIHYKNLTTGETLGSGPSSNSDYCIEADLFLGGTEEWYQSFQILKGPVDKPGGSISYHNAEPIGILKNGLLLEHTPPSSESTSALVGGIIPVDRCGWHPEPAGFGHFHAIPYGINIPLAANGIDTTYHCKDIDQEQGEGFVGFTFEGIPIYGPYETGGVVPTDLDSCYGHRGLTPDFDTVYHYHASTSEIINNPPCRSYYVPLDDYQFTYGTISSLPVTLTFFRAEREKSSVLLTWQTGSERNNWGFEIQRSTDGNDWDNIGFVPGVGNSYNVIDYNYEDDQPLWGVNYYRLRQLDVDGQYKYSAIVSVSFSNQKEVFLSPNPAINVVQIYGVSEGVARIYNELGQQIQVKDFYHATLDVSGIKSGLYYVLIEQEGHFIRKKLVIKK